MSAFVANPGSTTILRRPRRYIKFHNSINSQSFFRLIDAPDDYLDGSDAQVIKSDATSKVGVIDLDGNPLVIKRYNIKGPIHALKRAPRPSRAENNWRYARLFETVSISTPRVLAIIEHRMGPFRGRAYLIMEQVSGQLLSDLYQKNPPNPKRPEQLQLELVDLFKSLWTNRISHGDMKATNILISNSKPLLLDLDAAHQHSSFARLRSFAEKDVTRFLKNWKNNPELHTWFAQQLNSLKLSVFKTV